MDTWQRNIAEHLRPFSGYKMEFRAARCDVICDNEGGFSVSLQEHGGAYTVSFDGWHETFADVDEALNCFGFGLSDTCRLKVRTRGGRDCAWTVQYKDGDTWRDDSTTGMVFTRFWRPKRVEYRSNRLLPSPEET